MWCHRRISRRYLGYAAYHVGSLATIYNLWINESARYYTHLLPALMPLGALGLATLLRARTEKMLPRASRAACVLGLLLGIAAQSGKIMYEGHRRPGYEKEAALVIRDIVNDLKRSGALRGNLCIVSHNRFAMHALTGLPSTGYRASRGGTRYIVRKQERDMFARFLVVVDAHLRRLDPGLEVMGSHFADRRVGTVHIPIALAPRYREQGLKFADDLFEFYLLSRKDVEELLNLEARWEKEAGRVVHGTAGPPQEANIGTKERREEREVAVVASPASFPERQK